MQSLHSITAKKRENQKFSEFSKKCAGVALYFFFCLIRLQYVNINNKIIMEDICLLLTEHSDKLD